MKKSTLFLFVLMALAVQSWSQEPSIAIGNSTWQKLDEVTVASDKRSDDFTLSGRRDYAWIKLKVMDASIAIVSLTIIFDNGERQVISVAETYKAGGESRIFKVQDAGEQIAKVGFSFYESRDSDDGPPRVVLYGLY